MSKGVKNLTKISLIITTFNDKICIFIDIIL
jgi:hypothetical protein